MPTMIIVCIPFRDSCEFGIIRNEKFAQKWAATDLEIKDGNIYFFAELGPVED